MSYLGKDAQHIIIKFSGISLPGYAVNLFITHFFDDFLFEKPHFFFISVKEFQKTRLSSRGSLYAAQFNVRFQIHEIFIIHFKILEPKRRPFADRRQLSGLEVRKAERRQIFIF